MMRFLRRCAERREQVTFCESCAQVCTAACRATAHRERVQTAVLHTHYIR